MYLEKLVYQLCRNGTKLEEVIYVFICSDIVGND